MGVKWRAAESACDLFDYSISRAQEVPSRLLEGYRGYLPIDNNTAERAIQPFAIGRMNRRFSDTPKGATVSAQLYSLVETAKANGQEPSAWLCHALERLPQASTVEGLVAVELYVRGPSVNIKPTSWKVGFMQRLVREPSWQLIKGESPYERSYGETPRPRVMRCAP